MLFGQERASRRAHGYRKFRFLSRGLRAFLAVASSFIRRITVNSMEPLFERRMEEARVLVEILPKRHRLAGDLAQHALDRACGVCDRAACVGLWPRRKSAEREL